MSVDKQKEGARFLVAEALFNDREIKLEVPKVPRDGRDLETGDAQFLSIRKGDPDWDWAMLWKALTENFQLGSGELENRLANARWAVKDGDSSESAQSAQKNGPECLDKA